MHILSPETDNCPSWISRRESMTVENISWSISTKECCRLRWRLNPLGFSPLWFEPSSGHMWESQVLLTDGQVVFLRVLRFSPTFDERSARYKWNILERAVKPKSKKKKTKPTTSWSPVGRRIRATEAGLSRMILAIFDLQVTLILLIKFVVYSTRLFV